MKEGSRFPRKEPFNKRIITEIHSPRITPWNDIRDDVMRVSHAALAGSMLFPTEPFLKSNFENPENTTIFLQQGQRINGFSYAKPIDGDTAQVGLTVIHPDFQREEYMLLILRLLDETLKEKNFRYLRRLERIENADADIIEQHYQGKIRSRSDFYSPFTQELKRFFDIEL